MSDRLHPQSLTSDACPPPALRANLRTRRQFPLVILLFLLAILPFLPAIHGQFTWDDDMWLVNNAPVHAWNGLRIIWNPYRQNLHFYPITFTVFWLEHKLWALNPTGYHFVNMLLHAGATVLLYLCLRRLGFRTAWFGALLWAIHPVQVDSVAWVAEIKNALSGLLYFLAAWSYLRFERIGDIQSAAAENPPRRWGFYGLACLAFLLALLSKTVVCTLPAALLILLWCLHKKLSWKTIAPLIPMLVVGLTIASFTAHQERLVMVVGGASNLAFTPLQRIIIAGKDAWFYLRTLLLPYPLMAIYPRWTYDAENLFNYLPAAGVAVVGLLLFLLRKKIGRWPLGAFLFFLATLSPALGFINFFTMHYTFVADHYQYLASLGILLLLSESLARLFQHRRLVRSIVGTLLILALLPLTAFYASLFQTNMQLWSWNVARNPAAFTAQHNLGIAYLNAGQNAEGIRHIETALQLQPDDDSIQRTVGKLALADGKYQDAVGHFQKAIALRPNYSESYVLLGDVYSRMNRLPEALTAYANAVAAGPNDPDAYVAYAQALRKSGQLDEAARNFELAIGLTPGNMITRYNYGNLLLDMHRPKEAIDQYQFILKYDPNNPNVWDNLAAAYYQNGQLDQARAAKNGAKELDAQIPPAP